MIKKLRAFSMINPFKDVNWNPDRKEKRKFAYSLIVGFPILAMVWLVIGRVFGGSWLVQPAMIVGAGGAVLGLILWIVPAIARPAYVLWYGIACSIGLVISNLLLVSFYLTILTLFGTVRRAFGKKGLQKGVDKSALSYWRNPEKISDPKRYYSQF